MSNPSPPSPGAPALFDRRALARNRRRCLRAAEPGADFLLADCILDLSERLSAVTRTFPIAVDLGGHTGRLAAEMAQMPNIERVVRADLLTPDLNVQGADVVVDDAQIPFAPQSLDLIVSALSLHWVNDLPGTLIQIRQALKPDGLFLATLLGGETLHELKDAFMQAELDVTGGAAPRVSPFADTRSLGGLLQRAGFALPVADVDRITVRYGSAMSLLRDLRAMGATNVLSQRARTPLNRRVLTRMNEIYTERYADPDGRLRATFDIVSLSGWAPHESQQKPLKPGSAKMRLADALSTREE